MSDERDEDMTLVAEVRRLRDELAKYSRAVEAERSSDIEEERRWVAARCASIASAVGAPRLAFRPEQSVHVSDMAELGPKDDSR